MKVRFAVENRVLNLLAKNELAILEIVRERYGGKLSPRLHAWKAMQKYNSGIMRLFNTTLPNVLL